MKMWTGSNINSAMGLQATAATKRKHEITFDGKNAKTYPNSPPPVKCPRWSTNNANYNCAGGGDIEQFDDNSINNNNNNNNDDITTNNNNNNNCSNGCNDIATIKNSTTKIADNFDGGDNIEKIGDIDEKSNNNDNAESQSVTSEDKSTTTATAPTENILTTSSGNEVTIKHEEKEEKEEKIEGKICEMTTSRPLPSSEEVASPSEPIAAIEVNCPNGQVPAAVETETTTTTATTKATATAITTEVLPPSLLPIVATAATTTTKTIASGSEQEQNCIAKLEAVAAVPCVEPWITSPEPVDCISKLQAVAVPSDPWGSISTRSTLATTLLSADELDDDDDDFEDDYEEEESIIPTYCPAVRYHPFQQSTIVGTAPSSGQQQQQQQQQMPHHHHHIHNHHHQQQQHNHQHHHHLHQHQQHQQHRTTHNTPPGGYSPAGGHGYGSRPNYYSEPFPQQNCSRTGNQHLRMNGTGGAFTQWTSNAATNGGQNFYVTPDSVYATPITPSPPPPHQQQTIRCAENGKSYLELGCTSISSSPSPPPPLPASTAVISPFLSSQTQAPPTSANFNMVNNGANGSGIDARNTMKRCCDGRGTWCNTNRNCYKDVRLKIRNLSMFKLSRFRQVSEQSLYRSVLICNTLKYIDREIESEAKEMHQQQVAAAAAQQAHQQHQQQQQQQHQQQHHHLHHHHQQQQQQHHQSSQYHHHHQSHHLHHHPHHNHHSSHQHHQQQQHLHPQPGNEFNPVMGCARVSNLDYQHQQHMHQHQHHQAHIQQQQQQFHNQEREMVNNVQQSSPYLSHHQHMSKSLSSFGCGGGSSSGGGGIVTSLTPLNGNESPLHPYDHYPFRESQSGRATPFPAAASATSLITPAPISASSLSFSSSSSASNSTAAAVVSATTMADTDSGYSDDDSTRSINWSSVLSLSSQSALDPLNNNDLFSILPPTTSATSSPPSPPQQQQQQHQQQLSSTSSASATLTSSASSSSVSISGSFTAIHHSSISPPSIVSITSTANNSNTSNNINNNNSSSSGSSNNSAVASSPATTSLSAASDAATSTSNNNSNNNNNNSSTTFTTLSTISSSSATHSLTSSFVTTSMSTTNATTSPTSTWEYGFLDMDFGLGSEFTELVPSCKLSSDDLYKSVSSSVSALSTSRYSSVHDNELEHPAHIMVGS